MKLEMANRIKGAAYARGMNLGKLAEATCISRAYMSTLMRNGEPSEAIMLRIADALGVSIEWLKNGDTGAGLTALPVMLDKCAFTPTRAHETDAGLDLYMPEMEDRCWDVIPAKGSLVIDTGVHVLIPEGYVGMLKSKSGLNVKYGITSEGVIDAGYTGSIKVKLYNHGDDDICVDCGDKISQLVILPIITPAVELVDEFPETDRGANGFGSTGR